MKQKRVLGERDKWKRKKENLFGTQNKNKIKFFELNFAAKQIIKIKCNP